jgi:cAMP phosphodiesterase
MEVYMLSNTKFNSGLTYNEADALVEQYVSGIKTDDVKLAVLITHLKSAVRDSKQMRRVISSLLDDEVRTV